MPSVTEIPLYVMKALPTAKLGAIGHSSRGRAIQARKPTKDVFEAAREDKKRGGKERDKVKVEDKKEKCQKVKSVKELRERVKSMLPQFNIVGETANSIKLGTSVPGLVVDVKTTSIGVMSVALENTQGEKLKTIGGLTNMQEIALVLKENHIDPCGIGHKRDTEVRNPHKHREAAREI